MISAIAIRFGLRILCYDFKKIPGDYTKGNNRQASTESKQKKFWNSKKEEALKLLRTSLLDYR